jgi:hypothetical protein
MDIERFVEAPGRDEKIKDVRKKIDELGIEYLYLQFVSVTGKIMGKDIPADHCEQVAKKGFQLVYGATVNLFLNRGATFAGPDGDRLFDCELVPPPLGYGFLGVRLLGLGFPEPDHRPSGLGAGAV